MSARTDRAVALLRELSGSSAVEPGRRLGDIGIDSLAFAELALALGSEFDVELTALEIDESSSVGELLLAVERTDRKGDPDGLPPGFGRLQWLPRIAAGAVLRWWFRMRVEGSLNVPRSGPAVLAMNHESALDIPLVVVVCPRPITFMGKKELFKNGVVSWLLRMHGCFLVDRDRFDLRAVRLGLETIERGDVLGMYPEGTRSPGELLPFLHGSAWLALLTGAPIVPCTISGTDRAGEASRPGRVRVRVSFGPAIAVEQVDDPVERRVRAEQITHEVRRAIEFRLGR